MGNVFFKQNVLVEPMFNQWYAWPYLIPPASAAMYIANSHLKIMRSFVTAPQVHAAALKNPAMLGGPFINYDAGKVPAIKALIDKTTKEQASMLDLAQAIKTLDELLLAEAHGFSLASFYQRVPDTLKGYVELVYDLNNNPSIRFIEGLLYKSKFYNPASQSILLTEVNSDHRSFVFSTPRLMTDELLHLDIPFDHEGIDELCRMKFASQSYEYIAERLGVDKEGERLFQTFFTSEEPQVAPRYAGDGVRIRYFGHACVLIESNDVSILCDPMTGYKFDTADARYTQADLPETIDYALITHTHQDHAMFETLLQLRHKIKTVVVAKSSGGSRVDPSLKLILRQIGFRHVEELDEMESIQLRSGTITGLPFLGEHADLDIRTKMAYRIDLKGRSILLAADSNNLEPKLYQHIHDVFGDVDVLFIGMECEGAPMSWLYGPLLTNSLTRKDDQSRRFDGSDYEKGIALVDLLKPKTVYVYAMGQEPWCEFVTSISYTEESRPIVESNRLIEECERRGLTAERLFGPKELVLTANA